MLDEKDLSQAMPDDSLSEAMPTAEQAELETELLAADEELSESQINRRLQICCYYCANSATADCKECHIPLCGQHAIEAVTQIYEPQDFICPACVAKTEGDFGIKVEPLIPVDHTQSVGRKLTLVGNAWVTFSTKIVSGSRDEIFELIDELREKEKAYEALLERTRIQRGAAQHEIQDRDRVARLAGLLKRRTSGGTATTLGFSVPQKKVKSIKPNLAADILAASKQIITKPISEMTPQERATALAQMLSILGKKG